MPITNAASREAENFVISKKEYCLPPSDLEIRDVQQPPIRTVSMRKTEPTDLRTIANTLRKARYVSQKSFTCIVWVLVFGVGRCGSGPRQTDPPDPIWGFYDSAHADQLREGYARIDPFELNLLRRQVAESCDIGRAKQGLFLGQPNYTINGLEEEMNPGIVCNWNAARELIFFGRFGQDRRLLLGSRWFLSEHLRSISVYFPSRLTTVFRAWSITHGPRGWVRDLVHVDIRRPDGDLRYLFNRLDGGLLYRYELAGKVPVTQYRGLFFTSVLRRGEPNCLRYGEGGASRVLSGNACKLPDIPDPEWNKLFPR